MFLSSAATARKCVAFHYFRLAATALIAGAALTGCGASFPTPTPPAPAASLINGGNDGLLIPLHVERIDGDHARLGVPVQIDGKAVYLALDTGTQGVRVLKSVLPGSGYREAGAVSSLPLINGAQVTGAVGKPALQHRGTEGHADRRAGCHAGELLGQVAPLRRHGRLTGEFG